MSNIDWLFFFFVSNSAFSFIAILLPSSGKLSWFKLSLCSGIPSFFILIFDSASSSLLAKDSFRAGVYLPSVVKNDGKNSFAFSAVLRRKDSSSYSLATEFKISSLIKSWSRKNAEITPHAQIFPSLFSTCQKSSFIAAHKSNLNLTRCFSSSQSSMSESAPAFYSRSRVYFWNKSPNSLHFLLFGLLHKAVSKHKKYIPFRWN